MCKASPTNFLTGIYMQMESGRSAGFILKVERCCTIRRWRGPSDIAAGAMFAPATVTGMGRQMPDGFGGGTRQTTKATSRSRRRPSLGLMALEPRLMYDGAAAATAAAAATQPHADASAGSSASGSSGSSASSAPSLRRPRDRSRRRPVGYRRPPVHRPTDTSALEHVPPTAAAGGGSPAAPAGTPSSTAGHQIVFIDGNVPDAAGAGPGRAAQASRS